MYIFPDYILTKKMDPDLVERMERLIELHERNLRLARINKILLEIRLARMQLEVNHYMRMYNGNKPLKIYYQNIPGTISNDNLVATVDSLLDRLDPDILAIAEPSTEDLDRDWGPYILVPAKNKNGKKIRLNLLIKEKIKFKKSGWNVAVPNIMVDVEGWSVGFCYREWGWCGDKETRGMDKQMERWREFVREWERVGGMQRIMMGDFNFDFWSGGGSQRQLNGIREEVMDKIVAGGWHQIIKSNTRYQGPSQSCLDHIYCRTMRGIQSIMNENHTGYDHNCIGVQLRVDNRLQEPSVTWYRDISGITVEMFAQEFLNSNLEEIYWSQDATLAAKLLTEKINGVLDNLAPLKKRFMKTRKSAEWLNLDLRKRIKKRNKMRKEAVKEGNDSVKWKEFKNYRNKLKSDMLKERKRWIRERLSRSNGDEKDRWRQLKATMEGRRVSNDIVLEVNGVTLDKAQQVADHLNQYYVQKVQNIVKDLPPDVNAVLDYTDQYLGGKTMKEMEFRTVAPYEVEKIIADLKQTSAVGHDNISTLVLKRFAKVISPSLTQVINLSIMTANYPQDWKEGIISPVPKGGDLTQDKNWRPVTLLPILSKVLEKVLNGQIKKHFEENRIFDPGQHAYRSNKSCQTAWVDLDTKILKAVDEGKYVGLLLVDMSAAFNVVAKEVVIPKMKKLGVGPFAAKLLASYLSGRRSRVKIKGRMSDWILVATGIGEGSVLGPVIFIITIICAVVVLMRVAVRLESMAITACVDNGVEGKNKDVALSSTKFADDVTGVAVTKTEDQMQVTLQLMADEYKKYFAAHGLKINVLKSEHIVIGGPRTKTIIVDGRSEAKSVKLLGLTFDKSYKFDLHVDRLTARLASRNGQLSKVACVADKQTTRMLAGSIVNSVAHYACEVYGKDVKQINRVQVKLNNTMRIVVNAKRRTKIQTMLDDLKWLKLVEVIQYNKIMLLNKIISTQAAPYCMKLVEVGMKTRQNQYATRERELRIAWFPKHVRKGCSSYLYTATKLYNQVKLLGKIMNKKALMKHVKSTIVSWR